MAGVVTLARWLGPWADPGAAPEVVVVPDEIGGVQLNVYHPPTVHHRRRFVIAPGLHYAGPDDPRMDRFCRILAAAGNLVFAPFIADYLALAPGERAIADFVRVFDELTLHDPKHGKPVVFSISFGSLLAFALAATRPDLVERLIVFGGYADVHDTLAFCLTGQVPSGRGAQRDPLNQPVVLMNLLDLIEHEPAHRDALVSGWLRYARRTWGRPAMKAQDRFVAVAEQIAPELPEAVRDLFLIGVGARPGGRELAEAALRRFDAAPLDPTPYLERVRCRVDLVHGVEDDVIPYEQSVLLASRLVNAQVGTHITGMYGHTAARRPAVGSLARELVTMARVLRALAA